MSVADRLTVQALHHDALSRQAAATALRRLSYDQSQHFLKMVTTITEEASVRERLGLWNAAGSEASGRAAVRSERRPLDHMLPEWYAMHNARCKRCNVPIVPRLRTCVAPYDGQAGRDASASGQIPLLTASRAGQERSCAACSQVLPVVVPNEASKAAFPSTRARKRKAADDSLTLEATRAASPPQRKSEQSDSSHQLPPSRPAIPHSAAPLNTVASSSTSVSPSLSPSPLMSLDERKKKLRAEKKKAQADLKKLQAANPSRISSTQPSSSTHGDSSAVHHRAAANIADTSAMEQIGRSASPSIAPSSMSSSPAPVSLEERAKLSRAEKKRKLQPSASSHHEVASLSPQPGSAYHKSPPRVPAPSSQTTAGPLSVRDREKAAAKSHRAGLRTLLAQNKEKKGTGRDQEKRGGDKGAGDGGKGASGLASFLQSL